MTPGHKDKRPKKPRRHSGTAPQMSEDFLKTVLDASPTCIFVKNRAGRYVLANQAMAHVHGTTPQEMLGRTDRDYVDVGITTATEVQRFRTDDRKVIDSGEAVFVVEEMFTLPDGSVRHFQTTKAPLDVEGHGVCVLGVALDITERKRAEDALRESEAKYHTLFESANDAIVIADAESGRLTDANREAERLLGRSREEIIGMHQLKLHPPDKLEFYERKFRDHVRRGRVADYEAEVVRKDGTVVPVHISAAVMEIGGKTVIQGLFHDVTERKRAEEALKEERQRLFSLLDGLPAYVWLQAPDYSPRFVNRTFREHFGEPAGKPCYEVFNRGRKPCERCPTFRVFKTAKPQEWEWTDAASGRTYRVYDYPFADVDGSPLVLEMGVDVTDRRKAEGALRRSEAALRDIFEAASTVAFITTDLGGREARILEFSPGAEHIFGYSRDEVLGRPLSMLHLPEHVAAFPGVIESMRRTGKPVTGEVPLVRKSGERFPALLTTHPIFNDEGEMISVLGVSTDITDRKRAEQALHEREEELRQAQKMEAVGRLAGGIAHDFNNLLTAITGYSELLMENLSADDPKRQDAKEINKAGHQGASLVRQLLAFSRKQVLAPTVLDLNATVTGMQRMLRSVAGAGVELVTVLEAERPYVKADRVQIEQVLMNLVANARDAMPQGGRLVIETATVEPDEGVVGGPLGVKPGVFVMLSVTDTGIGMNEETRSRLFEPFFTTKEVGEGTGLGLSTIYGIVRQSGGDVRVYSEPGKGTTFKVYLPCAETPPAEADAGARPAAALEGTETILVVEDEEAVRDFVTRALRKWGYTVLAAGNSREAVPLGIDYEEPIDLLVTDVVMPGLTGTELAARLERQSPRMRVLYISGYSQHAGIQQELVEPGAPFLQKPFSSDALARKVREVLDESREAD